MTFCKACIKSLLLDGSTGTNYLCEGCGNEIKEEKTMKFNIEYKDLDIIGKQVFNLIDTILIKMVGNFRSVLRVLCNKYLKGWENE